MDKIRATLLNLYPTTKLLAVLFICISIFIVPGYVYAYSVLFICMFIAFLAGQFKEFSNLALKALLMIVLFIFILQSFFYPGTDILWSWWIFSIKQEGIDFAFLLTSKIVAIGSSAILFFRITTIKDLISSLESMGLPPKATYIFLSTLQIIPELKKLTYVIMDAQKTRGVETEGKLMTRVKAFLPTLSPLILGSIAATEERALTLESRAFSAKVTKTSLYQVQKTKADMPVRIGLLIMFILLVIGRVVL